MTKTNTKRENPIVPTNNSKTPEQDLAGMFEFYAQIVKLLILRNDNADVISKYSTWLDALRNHSDVKVKYDYVKLLLMGLKHLKPVCPFNEYPPAKIEPIETEWIDKARDIFFREDPTCRITAVLNPPILTAVSDDKCQFAAYQTIPKTGLQCFYAQSDEPLWGWFFKNNSLSRQPENYVQASPLDWERSLSGIHKKSIEPTTEKTSVSQKASVPDKKQVSIEGDVDVCKILDTIQEKRVSQVGKFKWTNNSLLTGETIAGSDLCIDWLIIEHEKTQLEIDEEMVKSFDKLYPDNFRLLANPELLEGIKKKLDCVEENKKWMSKECAKIQNESSQLRQCAGNDDDFTMLAKQIEKSLSENDLLMPTQYENILMEDIAEPNKDFIKLMKTDTTLPERHEFMFTDHVSQITDDHSKFNSSKYWDTTPSFMEAARSFNFIARKAEDTMREVNDWLKSKDRDI